MNNLNDPSGWNRWPEGPHGGKLTYALLVPMLSIAAFWKIWDRERQKQIQEAKSQTGLTLHAALQQEEERQETAHVLLQDVEQQLRERQDAFCSYFLPRAQRIEKETKLLHRVGEDPFGAELGLVDDIRDIFENDSHCGETFNIDKMKNGHLMWLYLKYWRVQVTLQKYKRAEERLKSSLPDVK